MRTEWLIPALVVAPLAALAGDLSPESQFTSPTNEMQRFNASYKNEFMAVEQSIPVIPVSKMPSENQFTPPPYHEILRFNENYEYLSDPALRLDLFDPLKYIPLRTNAPDWYLTLGGGLRERFEGTYNPNFGIGGTSPNSVWLQRITFLGDLHLGDRLRFFAEGISGVTTGEGQAAPPVQEDPIDLQFAFVDVLPYLNDDESLTVRVGRFGLSLGAGRLVATRAAPNIPFRFDGAELLGSWSQWSVTAFLTRPVEDNGGISGSNPATTFWGLYLTRWFDTPHKLGVDLYYLGINNQQASYASGTGKEQRQSFGARFFGSRNQWDWDEENILQCGRFGDQSILAWTASLDGGYTFDATWQPRLGLKVDAASGDHNPNEGPQGTFDALYFKSAYFNDASLLRPQNIIDVHPNLGLKLTQAVSVDGGADVFWRYSRNDGVYSVPGFISVPALDSASAYVGTALDINLEWQIERHLTFGASYVHFFSSSYVHDAGGKDVDYVSTTLSFLF
jgi:hypothetical protein